jgi:hypothetical protein
METEAPETFELVVIASPDLACALANTAYVSYYDIDVGQTGFIEVYGRFILPVKKHKHVPPGNIALGSAHRKLLQVTDGQLIRFVDYHGAYTLCPVADRVRVTVTASPISESRLNILANFVASVQDVAWAMQGQLLRSGYKLVVAHADGGRYYTVCVVDAVKNSDSVPLLQARVDMNTIIEFVA